MYVVLIECKYVDLQTSVHVAVIECIHISLQFSMHVVACRSLPTSSPLAALPQLFATYFADKISKLNFNLQTNPSSTPAHSLLLSSPPLLHSFTPATLLEIDNVLSQSSDSYCDLDPVPTTVLKKIFNTISPTILSIVNLFHNHWYLPFYLKIICNQPTVKKPSLNKKDLSNYRPIANLSFISNLTEKIVKKRLLDHLTSNSLLNPFQSAYTKFYSTETTLLSIHDHLSNAISMQQVSCLCRLDLSAAFDTLDHSIPYSIVFSHGLHPLSPAEFHKAPFSAQFFSIFISLVLALSSVFLLSLTSYMLTTHNSSYLLFLKISRLP